MFVRCKQDCTADGDELVRGKTYDLRVTTAQKLIARGFVEAVDALDDDQAAPHANFFESNFGHDRLQAHELDDDEG